MSNAMREEGSCMFYKLMLPSILQEKKLRIPEKFVKKHGKELASIATLTVPNGRIWLVELEKIDRKLWFHKGWHEFVEYYSIRDGHFLVFKYAGESNFNVYIFDLTVSEIRYPNNVAGSLQEPCHNNQCLVSSPKQEPDIGFIDIFGSGSPCHISISSVTKYLDNFVLSNCTLSEKYEHSEKEQLAGANFGSSKDIGVQFNESELNSTYDKVVLPVSSEAGLPTRRSKRITDYYSQQVQKIRQKVDEKSSQMEFASESVTRRWRTVTKEEKERAIRAANTYKPSNPFFKIILRPSYVYKGFLLHIPNSFSRKYMTVSAFITLRVSDGRQWPVKCVLRHGRAKLSKGWTEFVWGNNLEEGDVCVFELINMKDIVMKVTIFQVLEDEQRLTSE